MPTYTSDQNVKSGVPLGGIGAGKLEIMPTGVLDNFTFLNNIHNPLASSQQTSVSDGVLGFHFAVFAKDRKKKFAKLLQTNPVSDIPSVESIKYKGAFPFAQLKYEDQELPVRVELEAFSSFISGDEKNSGIPGAFFKFKITNPLSRNVEASIACCARNIIGDWCVGRFNQIFDSEKSLQVFFYNKKAQPHERSSGEMCLSLLKKRSSVSTYLGEWNMQDKPFFFDKKNITLSKMWESFSADGTLQDVNTERTVQSESVELGSALAQKVTLKSKSSATVTFVLSWYFPNFGEGYMYETWFRNVGDVAAHSLSELDSLYNGTKKWFKDLHSLKMDDWLKDALVNNLYPIISSSLWTKRDRFGLFESPQVCPLLGTLDVSFYGTLPLLLFFPNLEAKQLLQFAEAQRPQGYIPHDLGARRSNLASNSTNGLFWKDLNSKFILIAYRDYLLTGDEAALKKLYPFIKKAFYWLCGTDKNKDFLPDDEGADQTFDLWSFSGTSSYVSSIFLACLLALEKIALLMQDTQLQEEAGTWFKKGRINFEKKLWYKKYYLAYNSAKDGLTEQQVQHHVKARKVDVSCTVGQLAGQWIAHVLDLGYIVSENRVKKAVTTMLELNGTASAFGAVNAITPEGEKDKSCWHSENIWFGMTYMLASLAIYEGFQKEGLDLVKRAWENASVNSMNPWNQPDMYSSQDGAYLFGDHYTRNPVIWSVFWALGKKDKSIDAFFKSFLNCFDKIDKKS